MNMLCKKDVGFWKRDAFLCVDLNHTKEGRDILKNGDFSKTFTIGATLNVFPDTYGQDNEN